MDYINTEDLISEIEKQPAIWNTVHEDYNRKSAKKIAWEYVVRKFILNFDIQTPSDKKNIVLRFQRKWKSLRDCFTRELLKKKKERSGPGLASRKQYIYFNKLSFLQTLPKPTMLNISEEETSQDLEGIGIKEEVFQDPVAVQEPEEPDVPESPQRKRPSKSKKKEPSQEEELFAMLKEKVTNYSKQDDEDKLFMLSLVPELKRIPESMKLDVKIELINVFKRARRQNCDPLNVNADQQQSFSAQTHQFKPFNESVHSSQPINGAELSPDDCYFKEASSDSSDFVVQECR